MKRSPMMNFCKVTTSFAFSIAFLVMASLQQALAQDEAETAAKTTEAAATEASTEATAAEATAAETTALGEAAVEAEPATTLERIRANGSIRLGYRADAQPFSYRDEAGKAAGFSVDLCAKVAEQVKSELGLASLNVEWVQVNLDTRFSDLHDGEVDLLCGADSATLARREEVSFSLPIFPGGIGALVHDDAPTRLQLVLEGRPLPNQPLWRGYPAQVLQHKTFSAVAGSTAEPWLTDRINKLGILAAAVPVESYAAGIERVLKRESDALFGDRAILLDAAKHSGSADELKVLDRQFTVEPIALGLARGDEDFRLLVDRTLSDLYGSAEFGTFYAETFGEPDERVLLFYLMNTLPQ